MVSLEFFLRLAVVYLLMATCYYRLRLMNVKLHSFPLTRIVSALFIIVWWIGYVYAYKGYNMLWSTLYYLPQIFLGQFLCFMAESLFRKRHSTVSAQPFTGMSAATSLLVLIFIYYAWQFISYIPSWIEGGFYE